MSSASVVLSVFWTLRNILILISWKFISTITTTLPHFKPSLQTYLPPLSSLASIQCLIIGGGPCGLRTAIELALLGCKVGLIEKRETFSRNNVLHLWPFTIHDLRGLGAKKFYGKFCAGSIDHISEYESDLVWGFVTTFIMKMYWAFETPPP